MRLATCLLVFLLISLSLAASEGFSSLEEQMTGHEFKAAGLDKLTPQELAALNQWLRHRSLVPLDAVATAGNTDSIDRRGLPSDDGDNEEPIIARLAGEFTGWDGQTVFKLDNGMIWVQADNDKHFVKRVENPEVKISPGMFSAWYLSTEGSNRRCRVRRIQ